METLDLPRFEEARAQMVIDPAGKVRVCFEPDPEGASIEAVFECLSCVEFLEWGRSKSCWFCPVCSYELTIPEARKVVLFTQTKLSDLSAAISGRGPDLPAPLPVRRSEWRWVTWLLRLLRRRGA